MVRIMGVQALGKDPLQDGHGQKGAGDFDEREPVGMVAFGRGAGGIGCLPLFRASIDLYQNWLTILALQSQLLQLRLRKPTSANFNRAGDTQEITKETVRPMEVNR